MYVINLLKQGLSATGELNLVLPLSKYTAITPLLLKPHLWGGILF